MAIAVIISAALAEIIAGSKILGISVFEKAKTKSTLFFGTIIDRIAAATFGCAQTIAILLLQKFLEEIYQHKQTDN